MELLIIDDQNMINALGYMLNISLSLYMLNTKGYNGIGTVSRSAYMKY